VRGTPAPRLVRFDEDVAAGALGSVLEVIDLLLVAAQALGSFTSILPVAGVAAGAILVRSLVM
jgi:hypothetical protein